MSGALGDPPGGWRIGREEAVARILAERPAGSCLCCAILSGEAGPVHVVHEGARVLAVLNRYPRGWGQVLVLLRRHVTRFEALGDEEWAEASAVALAGARRIEAVLRPLRVYVSALGCHRSDLPMTTDHVHVHIDPVYGPEDRPSTVYSTASGIVSAPEREWEALRRALAW